MMLQGDRERRSRRIATKRSRSRKARARPLVPPQCLVLFLVVFFHSFCTTITTAAAANQPSRSRSKLRKQDDNESASANDNVQISSKFPTLDDTLEMASLSLLVYAFRNEPDDDHVCELINAHNYTYGEGYVPATVALADDIQCHWYQHDREVQGTQVLIVSSVQRNYIAVVFAGTDDLRSSLTDANIMMKPFGDGVNFTVPDPRVKIHAGFDNAVFNDNLFQNILDRINRLRLDQLSARLFTTGHSLGASDSFLTAVGLTLYYQQQADENKNVGKHHHVPIVTSLNFGCPRIGNSYWRDFVHFNPALNRHMGIWRFVLGWDLVPRLPEFMDHAGHTVQLYKNSVSGQDAGYQNSTADAYYQHHGDVDLGLAGVPFGWASKPFIWVPGSLWSHHITKYWELFHEWKNSSVEHQLTWLQDFVRVDPDSPPADDDGVLPNVDDDFWVDPPDDDATVSS
jgi:hypothetical protein